MARFFLGMFLSTVVFGFVSDRLRPARHLRLLDARLFRRAARHRLPRPTPRDRHRALHRRPRRRHAACQQRQLHHRTDAARGARPLHDGRLHLRPLGDPVAAFLRGRPGAARPVRHSLAGARRRPRRGQWHRRASSSSAACRNRHAGWKSHGRIEEADRVVAGIEARHRAPSTACAAAAAEDDVPDVACRHRALAGNVQRTSICRARIIISIFQFAQTIAVFGFTAFVPMLLVKHGFTIVHSLDYTAMIVLLAPVGAACAHLFRRTHRAQMAAGRHRSADRCRGRGVRQRPNSVPVIVSAAA